MITDARVFRAGFVPSDAVHRHREINALSDSLEPVTRAEPTDATFLFGPTGAGKTFVARYTMRDLQSELPELVVRHVNCWQAYTRFRVLYELLEGLDEAHDVHRGSTPKDELFSRLREAVKRPYLVVLDEADQLEDEDVLYDLYRIPAISIVAIANQERDVFATMDDRVRSRFGTDPRIEFDPYTVEQLVDILRGRAEKGLGVGAADEDVLRRVAAKAAGDARVAIGTLYQAARTAEDEYADSIAAEHVDRAEPIARRDIEQSVVDRLSEHQRAVYDIVAESGPLSAGDLYDEYIDAVDAPRGKRMVRKYLRKLQHYDLVESDGEKRGRTYDAR